MKFYNLRKAMGWSEDETVGKLGKFWCQVLEICEDGDISSWDAQYMSLIMGFKDVATSNRFSNALLVNKWVDRKDDGRILIHDWIDYAGIFLRGRYGKEKKSKLVKIWALHGRVYGNKNKTLLESYRNPIPPNLTLPNQTEELKSNPMNLEKEQKKNTVKHISDVLENNNILKSINPICFNIQELSDYASESSEKGITEKTLLNIMKKHNRSFEFLKDQVFRIIKSYDESGTRIKNIAALLDSSIKYNYKLPDIKK